MLLEEAVAVEAVVLLVAVAVLLLEVAVEVLLVEVAAALTAQRLSHLL